MAEPLLRTPREWPAGRRCFRPSSLFDNRLMMPAVSNGSDGGVMKKALTVCLIVTCLVFVPLVQAQEKPRGEKDLVGEKSIPAEPYCGVQTARAIGNFKISGVLINHYPGFVEAWALVKLAAARANTDVGAMKPEQLAAIEKACRAVLDGKYHDQFVVDWYQGGAGTAWG